MKIFAQFMALYFLLGSLFPWTDFSQLAKIPNLFEHYECHMAEAAAEGENPVFTDFFKEHFFGSINKEHQDPTHHQLPLKTINIDFQFVISKVLAIQFKKIVVKRNHSFGTQSLFGSDFSTNLYHPPIFA